MGLGTASQIENLTPTGYLETAKRAALLNACREAIEFYRGVAVNSETEINDYIVTHDRIELESHGDSIPFELMDYSWDKKQTPDQNLSVQVRIRTLEKAVIPQFIEVYGCPRIGKEYSSTDKRFNDSLIAAKIMLKRELAELYNLSTLNTQTLVDQAIISSDIVMVHSSGRASLVGMTISKEDSHYNDGCLYLKAHFKLIGDEKDKAVYKSQYWVSPPIIGYGDSPNQAAQDAAFQAFRHFLFNNHQKYISLSQLINTCPLKVKGNIFILSYENIDYQLVVKTIEKSENQKQLTKAFLVTFEGSKPDER